MNVERGGGADKKAATEDRQPRIDTDLHGLVWMSVERGVFVLRAYLLSRQGLS
jgi:hypothetical protein